MLGDLVGFINRKQVMGSATVLLLVSRIGDTGEFNLSAVRKTPDTRVFIQPAMPCEQFPRSVNKRPILRGFAANDEGSLLLKNCEAEKQIGLAATGRTAVADDISLAKKCCRLRSLLGLPERDTVALA